jgi:hypothetical protein
MERRGHPGVPLSRQLPLAYPLPVKTSASSAANVVTGAPARPSRAKLGRLSDADGRSFA